jgi:CheY-like chemotaxis protein/signal transduction histidine kinase
MKTAMPSVLVVDDSPKIVDLLINTLKNDFHLGIAQNGPKALDYAEKNLPDLILLDIMMPEMDGFEVCSRLKAAPETKDIPVVFITAMSETDDKIRGFDAGAVDYITKPFRPSEVRARIRTHLKHKEMREKLNTQNIGLKQKVEELQERLDTTIRTVAAATEIKQVLKTVLNRAMMTVNARIGSIMLPDKERRFLSIAAAVGLDESIVDLTTVRMGEGISGKVAQTGKALLMQDIEQDPVFRKSNDPKYESPSFICMPLRTHEKVVGVLNLSRKGDQKAFSKSDLKYLNALLTHINLAVENAGLLREAMEASQKLQQVVGEQSLQMVETQQQAFQSMELFHQAQKIDAMGTLAGGIAHHFNNLLMGIQGRVSLMLMDINPSHLFYEHLKGIEQQVIRGADLTKQLLGFARRGKYEVRSTDLNELIKKTSKMLDRTKKKIKVHFRLQKDLWAVEIDREQIEQVMMNLYANAWHAMPVGGDLSLETQNIILDKGFAELFSVEEGKFIKISVTDNGTGMDEATRQRIFEPFYTTKQIGKGSGLGLASAYGIIKNHDGIINVYSEPEKGTTFNIYLPASGKQVSRQKESTEEVLNGTEMILLVDDEDMVVNVGKQILERLGYRVLTAKSGKEAIEIYKENQDRINMVILDMIMPEIDGKMAYEKLKQINPDIKVLLSSGYSITGQALEILDQGCNGFIQKPFSVKDLSLKVREILD